MSSRTNRALPHLLLLAATLAAPVAAPAVEVQCPPANQQSATLAPGSGEDLLVTAGTCTVGAGTYHYGNVNIYDGGELLFEDATIDFHAASILIENKGSLIAGRPDHPIGMSSGAVLTLSLYGPRPGAQSRGISCKTTTASATCGVPNAQWTDNPTTKMDFGNGVQDLFYAYQAPPLDGSGSLFGHKVLAVSFGGTLRLFGQKGASYSSLPAASSGTSWARLDATIKPGDSSLVLDRQVDWTAGDEIVVTSTDYLPGHSETFRIKQVKSGNRELVFEHATALHTHNGERYPINAPARLGLEITAADTRAAVGLLSRSIRVVSEGAAFNQPLPASCGTDPGSCYFGGHTMARQGFAELKVQGVEFYQLGQGGRMGHYPVHFHLTRDTSYTDAFVRDSSVHDSMTRWMVLHGTSGVSLERNVGYRSIGHGYYIEDGSETDNVLRANLGVLARAAVDNAQNPRQVPGILADTDPCENPPGVVIPCPDKLSSRSDYVHPSVFWISNGWNTIEHNMAVGAGTCGACYWQVPMKMSGASRQQSWQGYAGIQRDHAGTAPLRSFVGNTCSTAMHSFIVVGGTGNCAGVSDTESGPATMLVPIANPDDAEYHYPQVTDANAPAPTVCDPATDCTQVASCSLGNRSNCAVTVLDGYTSSFHWANTNFGAIWLRPFWYLVTDSVLTDVQNGGLTMVSGGDYTQAPVGYWALTRKSAFIGHTQKNNPFASNAGPFSPGGLTCDPGTPASYCLSKAEGISMPIDNFAVNQRFFNIYDGPVYQEANAYLEIDVTPLTCTVDPNAKGTCAASGSMYGDKAMGIPRDPSALLALTAPGAPAKVSCYLPNAAIAWKQPNGFYYPPAFHSTNLYFDDVDIRHFVIEPLFEPGTQRVDVAAVKSFYCTYPPAAPADPDAPGKLFAGSFTDVDRQTELNDDDGSLTGLVGTVSVNSDEFFNAPVEALECLSKKTAKTSPYDYVTLVAFPQCATAGQDCGKGGPRGLPLWDPTCETRDCYGVPLYRQLLTGSEQTADATPSIRMMGAGISQRSTLVANRGTYYLDTTVGAASQCPAGAKGPCMQSVFEGGKSYNVFFIYAKPSTELTLQLYVGKDPNFDETKKVRLVRVGTRNSDGVVQLTNPLAFTTGSAWPAGWTRSYDGGTGLLEITANLSGFSQQFADADAERCGPPSFCAWDATNQVCAGVEQENDAVCAWSVKASDCPKGGCLGFQVDLAAAFATDPSPDPRPAASCFPKAGWDVDFTRATSAIAGSDCFQPPVSPPDFCP